MKKKWLELIFLRKWPRENNSEIMGDLEVRMLNVEMENEVGGFL